MTKITKEALTVECLVDISYQAYLKSEFVAKTTMSFILHPAPYGLFTLPDSECDVNSEAYNTMDVKVRLYWNENGNNIAADGFIENPI